MWIVLLIALLALAAFFYLRSRRGPAVVSSSQAELPLRRVVAPEGACPQARALDGQRYLAAEAPHFPLAGCGHGQCPCRLVPEPERRQGERRSGKDRRGDIRFGENPDRRSGKDRRRSGPDWSQSI